MPEPYAILGVSVVCADTAAEAERLAQTVDLSYLRIVKNERAPLASPEEAAAYPYTEAERERIRAHRSKVFVGTPEAVRDGLLALKHATGADELMAVTSLFDHDARKRSYTLLAEAFALTAGGQSGGSPSPLGGEGWGEG
jgi:alkanesulfonate monooxygenase SsuD/methylene tetrahydromethanopterin reductase-like flavin-dependent oxidoreductase (luciferase family)